jgi:hypothetical protein
MGFESEVVALSVFSLQLKLVPGAAAAAPVAQKLEAQVPPQPRKTDDEDSPSPDRPTENEGTTKLLSTVRSFRRRAAVQRRRQVSPPNSYSDASTTS